jgi:hypothetical protein
MGREPLLLLPLHSLLINTDGAKAEDQAQCDSVQPLAYCIQAHDQSCKDLALKRVQSIRYATTKRDLPGGTALLGSNRLDTNHHVAYGPPPRVGGFRASRLAPPHPAPGIQAMY